MVFVKKSMQEVFDILAEDRKKLNDELKNIQLYYFNNILKFSLSKEEQLQSS